MDIISFLNKNTKDNDNSSERLELYSHILDIKLILYNNITIINRTYENIIF